MTDFYSPSTKGFYSDIINTPSIIPDDKIVITSDYKQTLLDGLAAGQIININRSGKPVLVNRPANEVTANLAASARAMRNDLLQKTDWTQASDVPQATKTAWTAYRQALRDVPQQSGFPAKITWPVSPADASTK